MRTREASVHPLWHFRVCIDPCLHRPNLKYPVIKLKIQKTEIMLCLSLILGNLPHDTNLDNNKLISLKCPRGRIHGNIKNKKLA